MKRFLGIVSLLVLLCSTGVFAEENQPSQVLPSIRYAAHCENIGWQDPVSDGATAGTEGRALRLECLRIEPQDLPQNVSLDMQAHVAEIGWSATRF